MSLFCRYRTADSYESKQMVDAMERTCSSYNLLNGLEERFACYTYGKPTTNGAYIYKEVDRKNHPNKYVAKYVHSDNHESTIEPFLECVSVKGPVESWSCKVHGSYWKEL